MKKLVFSVVMAVFSSLLVASAASASSLMPIFWLFAVNNQEGTLASAGCGLSDNGQAYPYDLSSFSARIAIDDYSGNQQHFVTHTAPIPQSIQGWTVYIWTTPNYQGDTVQLRWSTQNMPVDMDTRLNVYKPNESWPPYADIGVNSWNAGMLTLPAIKTNYWQNGYRIEVTIRNTAVPEPGSLLALGSSLVSLVGFGLRHRR